MMDRSEDQPSNKSLLEIYTLGGLRLLRGGEPFADLASRKVEALLVYLACTKSPHPREVLADFLWDEFSQTRAMNNLRVVLSNLKKHLGDYVTITRDSVTMNLDDNVWLDVTRLESDLSAAREQESLSGTLTQNSVEMFKRAADLYQGEFLHGFYVRDARGFNEWFSIEREKLHRLMLDGLGKLVDWNLAHRDFMTGIQYATRWLQLDPLSEAAHREMMLLLAYSEQQTAAMKQYEKCVHLLNRELGLAPSEETTAIYKAIQEGRLTPPEVVSTVATLAPAPGEPPYKGLQYFDVEDADLFFGREELTAKLAGRLREHRFLAIVGASGSGKSSLVRAGLVPALIDERPLADGTRPPPGSSHWPVHIITPTTHPLRALAASLTREVESVTATASLMDDLANDPRSLHLYVDKLLSRTGGDRLLLVVDQFEELFTLCRDETERRAFVNNLLMAVAEETAGPLIVVITLRADFYAHTAQFENLRTALETYQVYIGQMKREELRRTIEGPADYGGWDLESGLVDLLLRDVGAYGDHQPEPGALPLLSHALLETWQRRRGHMLTFAGYADSGGVRGAIAQTAERVYRQRLTTEQQAIARNIFLRLTELGEGTQDTRRRVRLEELIPRPEDGPAVEAVLNTLAKARLVATGKGTAEVAHEALIREWPLLRQWLDEDREGLRLHRQLTATVNQWLSLDRDPGALYRGAQLAQASEWVEWHADELNPLEREFLDSSLEWVRREEAEREAQRQRELEAARNLAESETRRAEEQAQAAHQLRRRAFFLVGALVVLIILATVAIFAGQQAAQNAQIAETKQAEAEAETQARATAEAQAILERVTAEQQANLATSRELALAARNNLESDPELSILLALQALDISYTKEAEEALRQGVQSSRVVMALPGHGNDIWDSIYSPDGSIIATIAYSEVTLWDAATGQLLHTIPWTGVDFTASGVEFNETGDEISVITTGDNYENIFVNIWNVDSGELINSIELPARLENWSAALSPDWQLVALGREDGTVDLWDVDSAERALTLFGHSATVDVGLSFSSDGSRLVTTSRDGQVQVWDVEASLVAGEGQSIASFTSPQQNAIPIGAYFFEGGTHLALGFSNGDPEVWDLANTSQPKFASLGPGTWDLAIHPENKYLAVVGGSSVGVWDLSTGEELFTLSGQIGINSLDFSPDGNHLVTGHGNGSVRIWDVRPYAGGEFLAFPVVPGVWDLELSPNEQDIALGSELGPATVWDAQTGEHLLTLPGEPDTAVYRVAYHPDGSRIATVGEDGMVRVWDAETGKPLLRFTGHTEGGAAGLFGTIDVSYSPDGFQLATAGADGLAKVWDAETGQELMTLSGHTAGLISLIYSPDGRYIVTSSDVQQSGGPDADASIKIWDAETGQELYTFGPNPGRPWGLAFSPNGNLLAGSGGGFLSVWDLTSGEKLLDLDNLGGPIGAVAFTPDGQHLVTGGGDSASIWDLETGTKSVILAPTNSWRSALAWDGQRLYTGDYYAGIVKVYAVFLEDVVDLAQSRLTRSLTTEECQQYLHQETCP